MCNLSYSKRNRRLSETGWYMQAGTGRGRGGSVTMGASMTGRRRLNNGRIQRMKASRFGGIAVAAIAAAIGLSAPAYADPDTDFDNQLGRFGIYGAHDYNPYIAKI